MKTLILVDLQNDFLPGGALGVPKGDEVIPLANRLQRSFDLVIATQDWHPADHVSFAANHPGRKVGEVIEVGGLQQVLWPVHCVQGTPGAAFAPGFDTKRIEKVIHKGTDREIDSYSTFFDNGRRKATGLSGYLIERSIRQVYLAGLATDYCVKFSALDARRLGFETFVIIDACRGVDLAAGDVDRAVEEMTEAGVTILTSRKVLGER